MTVSWEDKFETGIQQIDYQHKRLFDLINDLENALLPDNFNRLKVLEVFDGLREYTVTHFYQEEILMEEENYPDLENHKAEHERFTDKIAEIRRQIEAAEDMAQIVAITSPLASFLTEWLGAHILKRDHEYIPYMKKR